LGRVIAFPFITAAVLVALFASMVSQYAARRRPYQVAWAVALGAGLIGTLAFLGSALSGGDPWLFRVYYLGGAVLTAPLLGLGSTLLLPRRGWFWAMLAVAVLAGIAGAVGLAATPIAQGDVAGLGIQPGTTLVTGPAVLIPVIAGNTLGTIAVVGVGLWSLWSSIRGQRPWTVTGGNALIVVATLVIAAAGSLARLGAGAGFWGMTAVGFCVLYAGVAVMGLARAPRPAQSSPAA
jgi:hypothetical protein